MKQATKSLVLFSKWLERNIKTSGVHWSLSEARSKRQREEESG